MYLYLITKLYPAYRYKSLFILFFLFLCNFSLLQAQTCSISVTISPNGPPPICQGQTVNLTATTTETGVAYQWFKEDTTGVRQVIAGANDPAFSAAESGRYYVEITNPVTTCSDLSPPVAVTVNPLPVQPDFQLNPTAVQCSGSPINFAITNPQTNETYVWSFGDGATAIGSTVSHTYQEVGAGTATFEVSVYSRSQGGCNSLPRSQFVSVNRKPNFTSITDSASFNVCIPDDQDTIKVQAKLLNATTPPPADVISYIVNWGNGPDTTYQPGDFTATTFIRNRVPYDTTGTFPITIRALGSNGCETVIVKEFVISKKPTAKFTANKDRIQPRVPPKDCIPVKVTVDSDSTSGEDLSYKWAIQDNQGQPVGAGIAEYIEATTDTSKSPVLQFNVSGRYNLQLIVSNTCGSDTTSQSLLVGYPEVQLNADTTSCGPTVINFSGDLVNFDANLGTIDEASYEWRVTGTGGAVFVNGTTAKSRNPQISFPNVGEYEVTVRVANECGYSDAVEQQGAIATITINPIPAAPVITGLGITICEGDTTSIKPNGPGTNFEFYTDQTGGNPVFTGRAYNPGPLASTTTYYIATLDAKGCVSTTRTPFTVTVLPEIANNIIELTAEQEEVCQGQPFAAPLTGSQPTGGNGSPLYLWQSSLTGNSNDFVSASTAAGPNNGRNYTPPALTRTTWYRRLVTSGSCTPDTSNIVMIMVNPPITNNTINVIGGTRPTICEGEEAPEITGSQPDGTPVIVWESSLTSGTAEDFGPATGVNSEANYTPGPLTQTTWFRRRITTGGCTSVSAAIEITVTPKITENTIESDQIHCSTTTAPAPLTGSLPKGGNGTPVYLWQYSLTGNDDDFAPAPGNNNRQNYSPAVLTQTTWFRRTVTTGTCEPNLSNEVVITIVPAIENNIIEASQTVVCAGTVPTLAGTAATGGTGDLVYLWESSTTGATTGFNPASGTNDGQEYTPEFITQNMWFRRTVTSADTDCPPVASNVVAITIEELPEAPLVEAADVQVCQGTSATLRVTSTGSTYEWYSAPTSGTPVFYGQEFVTAPLTGNTTFYVQAVSANKCASAVRTPVKVTVTSITANAGRDTTIIEGQTMELKAKGGTQYLWTPSAGLNDPTAATPIASPAKTTTYTVRITTEDGCEATDEVTITVIPRIVVVNTFSPNRDGINETWDIQNIENFPNATVEIFNRWGNQVFKSQGAYKPWDGTYNGNYLPLATYYYIIRLNQDEKPITGSVTIIR